MRYHWLLFDADNTLFDYDQAELFALAGMFEQLGHPFSTEVGMRYRHINHHFWRQFERGEISQDLLRYRRFEALFEELSIQEDGVRASQVYLDYLGSSHHLIDGAVPLLQHLGQTHRLALITNGLREVQRSRLQRTGLGAKFEVTVISDEVGVAKPAKEIFDIAFRQMGRLARRQVLMIGDSLSSDMRGGLAYGLDTCWFNPQRLEPDPETPVTYEIQALCQLPPLLDVASSSSNHEVVC